MAKMRWLADPRTDVAVVKVDANNLPVLTLGDSSRMEVGNFTGGR